MTQDLQGSIVLCQEQEVAILSVCTDSGCRVKKAKWDICMVSNIHIIEVNLRGSGGYAFQLFRYTKHYNGSF